MGTTSHIAAGLERYGLTPSMLWFSVLGPPLAFASTFTAKYTLANWACDGRHPLTLQAIDVLCLAVIVAAMASAWRGVARIPEHLSTDGSRPDEIGRFMSLLGLASASFFAVVTIATVLPEWIINACR